MASLASEALQTAIAALTTNPPGNTTSSSGDSNNRSQWARWLRLDTCGDPALEGLVDACAQWGRAFRASLHPVLAGHPAPVPVAPRWLSIIGTSGVAKTMVATRLFQWADRCASQAPAGSSLARHYGHLAYLPHRIYWPGFIQQLRGGKAFDLREDMKRWPVLLLDDIGAERDPSGYSLEELNTLLGCRDGKWTLLTSNLTLDTLETLDRRIVSRMIRGHNRVVTVETIDYSLR
jgi:hypothetical protein